MEPVASQIETIETLLVHEEFARHCGIRDSLVELVPHPIEWLKREPGHPVIRLPKILQTREWNANPIERLDEWWLSRNQLGLDELGMVLAGGALTTALAGGNDGPKDFDLFLVGLTEEQARVNIKIFLQRLKENSGRSVIEVYRTDRVLTFEVDQVCIQVILCLYSTIDEVLHGFDMGPCQLALYQGKIMATQMAQYCYDHGCIIPMLYARRASFEPRLEKYYNRGFELVLPYYNGDFEEVHIQRTPYLRLASGGKPDWGGSVTALQKDKSQRNCYDGGYCYAKRKVILRENLTRLQAGAHIIPTISYSEGFDIYSFPMIFTADDLFQVLPNHHRSDFLFIVEKYLGALHKKKIGKKLLMHMMAYDTTVTSRYSWDASFRHDLKKYLEPVAQTVTIAAAKVHQGSYFKMIDGDQYLQGQKTLTFAEWYGEMAPEEEGAED